MSVFANILGYKLKGTFVKVHDDKTNDFVIRIENAKGDFIHVPYISKKAIAHDRNELIGAFRKILLSATFGANNPKAFCALIRIEPSDPKAERLFQQARKLTETLDELIPLSHSTLWFDLAKKITQQGVSADLG